MSRRRVFCLLVILVLGVVSCVPAMALDASTLHNGSRGDAVKQLQQALIDLGYLKGAADGIFGNQTEKAVRSFQKANKLSVDGLAGKKTQSVLFAARDAASSSASAAEQPAQESAQPAASPQAENTTPAQTATTSPDGSLFGGNYTSIRIGATGSRVKTLQSALISLNYLSGKADGIFGNQTLNAVLAFQKANKLSQDGVAGKKTLTALEKAVKNGDVRAADTSSSSSSASSGPATSAATSVSAPSVGEIKLLHWFNDIKPSLSNGNTLVIYDPSTGLSWNLKVLSRGRHCDCEPATKADTDTMVRAFGNRNTWTQKGVYVKLPNGTWTIGSTHDMPHQSGSIKDNGFDGHLCVHFLRDMAEAEQNDPNYGVANQKTIRELWKSLTGQDITN
ncbi:MAG: peptidoglycan-binding protein [Clostridiales bacterium]|nr:peptidoglycan-binding protein [Clostridiales bacterium]